MTSSPAVCASCQTPLPADAEFCPHCGTRTPTQISGGGTTTVAVPSDQFKDQQVRLQNALGPDYSVDRMLGTGGFAVVWAAFDRKLQRHVAVKVLHPELVVALSLLERFQREARAVAKLRHPGIIPIYAVGEHEGLAYYIMPLVEGESLRQRLNREGALAPDEVRRILRESSSALAVAHEAGIVHRDVKPENLMLEGKGRRVVVMDFGIAKSTAGAAQTGLTGTGMIIGTPAHMSPERATGSKEIDVRSDVYSLGVVGFEMLAGRPPFKAASVPELIKEHVATPAPSVSSLRADTPEDLAIAVNRCLQKEPGERWKDAGDLSAFLERVSTPSAQPFAVSKDLRKFARRGWRPSRRLVFWTAAGALVLTATLLIQVSAGDLLASLGYWSARAGLSKPVQAPVGEAGLGFLKESPGTWALGGRARVLPMGGSNLAVIDAENLAFGLHLFDGQAWRSYRTPEPIGAAAQAGNDILLFAARYGGHVYRWSGAGVDPEDTVPFGVQAAWADAGNAAIIGRGAWRLAVRDARGWHRVASPRRTWLRDIGGTGPSDLVALGITICETSGCGVDSIAEFDGTSWEALDPRPPHTRQRWSYNTMAVLADRTPVIAGGVGERSAVDSSGSQPLLLVRSSRGHWRRMSAKMGGAASLEDIGGVWGAGPDDLIVWSRRCDTCRLAEVRGGVSSESQAMGPGSVVGVAQAGGVLYAVWADGTVWARRSGRWVYVTEVPKTAITSAAFVAGPDWETGLRLGDGLLWYHVRDTGPAFYAGEAALDSLLAGSRGVAVGRRIAWALGRDGFVRRLDCTGARCAVIREGFSGGLSLVQRRGGGALLAGANGLLTRANERGVWKRMPLPQAMARESLLSASGSADGRLAVLGSQHLLILDSLGKGLRLASLPGPSRPVSVLLSAKGAVALLYPDMVSIERA